MLKIPFWFVRTGRPDSIHKMKCTHQGASQFKQMESGLYSLKGPKIL